MDDDDVKPQATLSAEDIGISVVSSSTGEPVSFDTSVVTTADSATAVASSTTVLPSTMPEANTEVSSTVSEANGDASNEATTDSTVLTLLQDEDDTTDADLADLKRNMLATRQNQAR